MNSASERSPQPPNDEHEHRITALEEDVKSQQRELLLLRPHIDNGLAQLGTRIDNGLLQLELRLRIEIQASEQRLTERAIAQSEAIQASEQRLTERVTVQSEAIHAAEQRLTEQVIARAEANQKRAEEHFRWIFGLLVIVLLSNSAAILTMMNLLQNR